MIHLFPKLPPLLEKKGLTPEQMADFARLYHSAITPPNAEGKPPLKLAGGENADLHSDFITHDERQRMIEQDQKYLFLLLDWATVQEHGMSHRPNVESLLANLSDKDFENLSEPDARTQIIDRLRLKYKVGTPSNPEVFERPAGLRIAGSEIDADTQAVIDVMEGGRVGADWATNVAKDRAAEPNDGRSAEGDSGSKAR
ncbi:MAG: hypothetical protein LW823_06375 [Rickettsiales bacterium]|nr:hypothetical protein [Rickettsiales bacterium]